MYKENNKKFARINDSHQKGFSLIELIIVVVIIGVISAIAIPNLLKSKASANEASAVSTMRTIHGAQVTYKATAGSGAFTDMPTLRTQGFIDSSLGAAPHIKSGYRFEVDVFPATATLESRFNLRGRPQTHAITNTISGTGSRDFGTTESGAIFETADNTPVLFDEVSRVAQGTATPIAR